MIDSQHSLVAFFQEDLFRLLGLVFLGGLTGWLLGFFWTGVLFGLMAFMWQQWNALYQLYRWLRFNPQQSPPELRGVWSAIVYNVQRMQVSERRARDNLMVVITRARESVSALEEAVVLINSQNLPEWWNPAAERLLGLRTGDQRQSILNIIRKPEFASYFETPSLYQEGLKIASWVKAGRYLQCELTIFGKNDRLLIAYDITRLNNLEQMRKDFVANVSHELRTPLTVLSGYLESFGDQDDLNPRWRRGFDQMQQQTQRMTLLVNDLLLLSRLENEGLKSKRQHIAMRPFLQQIYDDASVFNTDHAHRIGLSIESDMDLLGSEKEIASAFVNLVTNAIKYTPKGGVIELLWSDDGKNGYFSVTDNGIGIEAHHVPRLTERFYRVDSGRSRETGGTGLGLAIVKHVLHQHDAYLDIQSTLGKGSRFSCVFPASRLVPHSPGQTPQLASKSA